MMEIVDIACNAMIRSAVLIPVAIGLTMTYKLLNFANFAHVEIATVGAYITFFLNVTLGLDLTFAAFLGIATAGVIAIVAHKLIFQRLSKAGIGSIAFMITSFGLALICGELRPSSSWSTL